MVKYPIRIERLNKFGRLYVLYRVREGVTDILIPSTQKKITVAVDLDILNQGWFHWQSGVSIQHAFSTLNAGEREFLLTGITPTEWDKMVSEGEK
jgi:hypothetical protein